MRTIGLLRPGLYLPVSEALWTRQGARIPDHLLRTKVAGGNGVKRSSRRYRTFRAVAGAFVVQGPSRGRTAQLVVAAFDGGTVVLDEAAHRVHRTYGTGSVSRGAEERRRRFTEHVSAPRFRTRDGGRTVEEELVDGAHLDALTPDQRVTLIGGLVRQFAALTSAYEGDPPAVTDRELEALLRRSDAPPDLVRAWESSPAHWLSAAVPWVPTPREANAKNIVVRPDGRPAPIDLGDLRTGPFFDYPIGILLDAGDEVVRRFLDGEADCSVGELFAAAGQSWEGTAEERAGLLLSRIVHAAYRDSLVEDVPESAVFAASLRRRWDEAPGLDPRAFARGAGSDVR